MAHVTIDDIRKLIEKERAEMRALYYTSMKIEKLTKMPLEELLEKIEAGWTLEPPTNKDGE